MRGLHISMMSAHWDRQQNPRTPHCLIRMGNINLINPQRFPVTAAGPAASWDCSHPRMDAGPLLGPGCLCHWLACCKHSLAT